MGNVLSKNFRSIFQSFTRILAIGLFIFLTPSYVKAQTYSVELNNSDRILILAPHPDDEILGCGGIIQKAILLKRPIKIVFLTYGDNNEQSFIMYRKRLVLAPKKVQAMGLVRQKEAFDAAKILGVSADNLIFLGYPDFGTFHIWCTHWNQNKAFKSMLTKVQNVPYPNAFRPKAPYKGEDILEDLSRIIRDFKPTKIFLSHPADQNPDHRALYLFTRVALWNLKADIHAELFPYLIHFKEWPKPRGNHPNQNLTAPESLKDALKWQISSLGQNERNLKLRALAAHRTQISYNKKYLLSFIRSNELFGDFSEVHPKTKEKSASSVNENKTPPDELTDVEKVAFVGLEWKSIRIEKGHLIISIQLSRPLAQTLQVSTYVFGYRSDKPFEQMPKIRIQIGLLGHQIFDQDKKLPPQSVTIERSARKITLTIDLKTLGYPEKILTSARTYLENVPLDWTSWRIVDCSKQFWTEPTESSD